MTDDASVFERHYRDYLKQIAEIDLSRRTSVLGAEMRGERMILPLLGIRYRVSGTAMADETGRRPSYAICVVLAKYVLECPLTEPIINTEWASYRDFKDAAPLVTYFTNDVEQALTRRFTGKTTELRAACRAAGGAEADLDVAYDVAMGFEALPRVPMLLLFNDADEDFPAKCSVLFQRSVEKFLDMESVAVLGKLLADLLIQREETR